MRRLVFVLFCIVLAAGAISARAQVLPSAERRKLTITVGGEGSVFQPDFAGNWTPLQDPIAESSDYPLIGIGAYVDAKFTRWVQIEAEGRWLRFNQAYNIHQDTYLIGPRVPVYQFKNSTLYGKVLIGYGKMTFDPDGSHGNFTDVAFGGGMDVRLTRKISLRAFDFEYQDWPKWGNSSLHPYGGSVGIGYRVF